jgi:penicillin amidase
MSYDLAGYSDDFYMTNVLKKYGAELLTPYSPISHLLSTRSFLLERYGILTLCPFHLNLKNYLADVPAAPFDHQPNPENGSNNWAVNGTKTASGSPILCGDPHLGLNLPSLWFQMQLVSPDCNVSGATLPGTHYYHHRL